MSENCVYREFDKIYSHPPEDNTSGKLLLTHSEEVTEFFTTVVQNESEEFGRQVCYHHDIGKTTQYFQDKIREEVASNDGERSHHSWFGAVMFYLSNMKSNTTGLSDEELQLGFIVLQRHHSNLPDTIEEFVLNLKTNGEDITHRESVIREQLESVHNNPYASKTINKLLPTDVTVQDMLNICNKSGFLQKIGEKLHNTEVDYGRLVKVYGTLVFADKMSLSEVNSNKLYSNKLQLKDISKFVTDEYNPPKVSQDEFNSVTEEMNKYRELARRETLQTISNLDTTTPQLTKITLPTGFGKTISSLSAAMYLKNVEQFDNIIYSLPFTSIVDQTDDTIQSVFDVTPTSKPYTIHHHLAQTKTQFTDIEESTTIKGYDTGTLHAESWLSELTLTTFVQLFETLTAPTNKQAMKLGAIQNSVIIIDEIQSLPTSWWGLISNLFETLIKEYNCHIISITATHPQIYNRDSPLLSKQNPIELVTPDTYYEFLTEHNRVNFEVHQSAESYIKNTSKTPIETTDLATEVYQNNTSKNTTIITNTITSAIEIYNLLKTRPNTKSLNKLLFDKYEKFIDCKPEEYVEIIQQYTNSTELVCNLTTKLRPKDRKILINILKQLTENEKFTVYVSTTQIIEAGVDISFDVIYRDVAPASSIVQAAGRCNRAFGNSTGKTIMCSIISSENTKSSDEEVKVPADKMYAETVNRLKYLPSLFAANSQTYTETDIIQNGVNKYYQNLFDTEETGEYTYVGDKNLTDAYINGNYKLLSKGLIKEQESIDILLPPTEEIANEIADKLNQNQFITPSQLIYEYQEYVVSINLYKLEQGDVDVLQDMTVSDCDLISNVSEPRMFINTNPTQFYSDTGFEFPTNQSQIL